MCKKLLVVLAMVAMVSPAMAITRGHWVEGGTPPPDNILLKVDINKNGASGPNETQAGWTPWEADVEWGPFGPMSMDFGYGTGLPYVVLNGFSEGAGGNLGGSRDRIDPAPLNPNDNDYANVYRDLVYVATGNDSQMGLYYMQMDLYFGAEYAGETLQLTMFNYDKAFDYSGEQEDSKRVAWSTTNPADWLADNGYPTGYVGPWDPNGGMPAGLAALVNGLSIENGTFTAMTQFDDAYGMLYSSTFEITLNEQGSVTVYGWADILTQTGSKHTSLNGFVLSLPEPATIALLGLGGLALIRRKR